MKMLIYCTKSEPYLTQDKGGICHPSCCISDGILDWHLNGKIVAECDFEVEEIKSATIIDGHKITFDYKTKKLDVDNLHRKSCLDYKQMNDYLFKAPVEAIEKPYGYAIHIKNLNIFDKPKELSYFGDNKGNSIQKAPQNMMYCWEYLYSGWEDVFEKKIIISIRPEWVCKILNGEKTIEVRKKILKEMMKDG